MARTGRFFGSCVTRYCSEQNYGSAFDNNFAALHIICGKHKTSTCVKTLVFEFSDAQAEVIRSLFWV